MQMVSELALKAGPKGSSAYVAALKAMLGGTAGLRVGLQLTGAGMGDLVKNTAGIAHSMHGAKGVVQGFALAQKDAAFKMDRLRAVVETTGISVGQKLLPVVTKLLTFIGKHVTAVLLLAGAIGGTAIAVSIANSQFVKGIIKVALWAAAQLFSVGETI